MDSSNCIWLSHNFIWYFMVVDRIDFDTHTKKKRFWCEHWRYNIAWARVYLNRKRLLHTNWLEVNFYIPKIKEKKNTHTKIHCLIYNAMVFPWIKPLLHTAQNASASQYFRCIFFVIYWIFQVIPFRITKLNFLVVFYLTIELYDWFFVISSNYMDEVSQLRCDYMDNAKKKYMIDWLIECFIHTHSWC